MLRKTGLQLICGNLIFTQSNPSTLPYYFYEVKTAGKEHFRKAPNIKKKKKQFLKSIRVGRLVNGCGYGICTIY